MWLLLAVAPLWPTTPAPAEELLLSPARYTSGWTVDVGGEFPGATGTMAVVPDADRGSCVQGRFTFAGDSRYSGLKWTGTVRSGQALGFWIKPTDRDDGWVRVRDAGEQELVSSFRAPRGEWTRVRVPLVAESFTAHWGGANDGQLHSPLAAVLISLNRGPDQAEMRVSDLYVETDDVQPAERWQITMEPPSPVGVALPDEEANFTLRLLNRLPQPAAGTVRVEAEKIGRVGHEVGRWDLEVRPWESVEHTFTIATDEEGYTCLRARLTDREAGLLPAVVSGLAVVPRPRHLGEAAPDCYFGLQAIPDLDGAERLGAKALRNAPGWLWAAPSPDTILFESYLDGCVYPAREHQMDILLTLQPFAPAWAAWHDEARPRLASLPDPARLELWRDFCRQVAARYRGQLAAIEVANEPDLTCYMQVGLSLDEAVDYYVQLLRAAREGIRAADPDVPVAGLDVSGGDFDLGLPFTRAVLDQGAELLDLYTGHPYASPRYFGPGNDPVWPQANRMAEKCTAALDLLAEHGRRRRMWIGELGWGLGNTIDPLDPDSLDFAACVAQSLIVGKSVPGVEKNLHFTMAGCNEAGYEYGLLRGDPPYPLPAALAYATAAYVLDAARPLRLTQVTGRLSRASFACPERDELLVAWWSDGEPVRLHPPADAPRGRWVGSLFQALRARGPGLPVGRLPVYWVLPLSEVGEEAEVLDRVTIEAGVPVTVQRAYLTALDRLALLLTNQTTAAQQVEVEVGAQRSTLALPPGGEAQHLEVPLAASVAAGEPVDFEVTVSADGHRETVTVQTRLEPLPGPPPGSVADGDLGEWKPVRSFELRDRQSMLPPDPNIGWLGPEDLSVQAYVAADDRGLYFAAAVTDDIHSADQAGVDDFWNSDSIQIALDPDNDSAGRFDDDDREVGLVLGAQGPMAYVTYPLPRHALQVPLAIRRAAGQTLYEALLPWDQLGVSPPIPGRLLALDFIANENDGQGRAGWMGLTPGIGEAKRPEVYRRFVRVGE